MQKSDIIFTVVLRADKMRTLDQVRKELNVVLSETYSRELGQWDKSIDPPIANAIIHHMSLHARRACLKDIVRDVDMILHRIS